MHRISYIVIGIICIIVIGVMITPLAVFMDTFHPELRNPNGTYQVGEDHFIEYTTYYGNVTRNIISFGSIHFVQEQSYILSLYSDGKCYDVNGCKNMLMDIIEIKNLIIGNLIYSSNPVIYAGSHKNKFTVTCKPYEKYTILITDDPKMYSRYDIYVKLENPGIGNT